MILMGSYIYIRFYRKILSNYFINFCYILISPDSELNKFIDLSRLLIYRVFDLYNLYCIHTFTFKYYFLVKDTLSTMTYHRP